jgi:hypothetical protein
MKEKKEDGIKILLKDINKEFYRITPQWQIRSAIEQILYGNSDSTKHRLNLDQAIA